EPLADPARSREAPAHHPAAGGHRPAPVCGEPGGEGATPHRHACPILGADVRPDREALRHAADLAAPRTPRGDPAGAGPEPAPQELFPMSLYYTQKLLFQLNRDPAARRRLEADLEGLH